MSVHVTPLKIIVESKQEGAGNANECYTSSLIMSKA